jgi:hypothetical protein
MKNVSDQIRDQMNRIESNMDSNRIESNIDSKTNNQIWDQLRYHLIDHVSSRMWDQIKYNMKIK